MIFYTIADRQKIMIILNQPKVIYLNERKDFQVRYKFHFVM